MLHELFLLIKTYKDIPWIRHEILLRPVSKKNDYLIKSTNLGQKWLEIQSK